MSLSVDCMTGVSFSSSWTNQKKEKQKILLAVQKKMVILETAAIGVAGYGLYRGGDAAIRKGKETTKEIQRERVRQSQRSELQGKVKTRQDRIKELCTIKQGGGGSAIGSSNSGSIGGGSSCSRGLNDSVASTASSRVDERHQNVMQKLRQGRMQQSVSGSSSTKGPGSKLASLFGKGK